MVPVAAKRRMSEDEYFKLLEESGERLEYWDGVVEGMSGSSPVHSLIESNLFGEMFKRLDGTDCFALSPNQAIFVAARSAYFFADLSVVCGKADWVEKRGIGCLINPSVVVEVLSPSTSMKDEMVKFHAYTALKSVREYLLVSADQYGVKLHERATGDAIWKTSIFQDLDDEFELKSCGVRLKVRDVYGPRVIFEA
jgi:Uma2 family endonuclease